MPVISILDERKNLDILKDSYINKKMSTTDIARESNILFGRSISCAAVYNALIRNKINVRNKSESVSMATSTLDGNVTHINEELIEWIDGFLLGDGSIGFRHDEKFMGSRYTFGSSQIEWTKYAMSGLKCYSPDEPNSSGKIREKAPNPIWSSRTLTHPDIVIQAKRWYPITNQYKKGIPLDVRITPTSLLLWYLGDGSISKVGVTFFIRLATCSFTPQEIDNILIPKLTTLGLVATRDNSKNDIRISSISIRRFFEIIGTKSPILCYNYKFEYGEWLNLYRLSDIVKNDQEKWRIQYLFKQGKLDCSTSPGEKLIMFTEDQKNKIRSLLDNHLLHEEYEKVMPIESEEKCIKVSDIIKNDIERWNARYLITRKVIQCTNSILTDDQAVLLRKKLDEYGDSSAIPHYKIDFEFRKYRELGFPFYEYSDEILKSKLLSIGKFDSKKEDGLFKWDGYGTELANYFHPQMFECRKKGKKSPVEFFNSDIDFKRGILKIIALYSDITQSNIREICCNESASSRINNFPPRVMMSILKSLYSGQKITMLDPCSGFSGRLIGAYTSGIVNKYIGMDLCDKTYDGLIKTSKFVNDNDKKFAIDIKNGNCLDILPTIKENIDFIFTSPPFLDEEEYVGVAVERDYSVWKDVFISPFIEKCYSALNFGGKFSVYTEAIRRNDFPVDFCNIAKEVGFKRLDDIGFSMPRRENLRNGSTTRTVNVIVFEK